MTDLIRHTIGAPCWVESLQPEPETAVEFYRAVLGWDFVDASENYWIAQLDGRRVVGIGPAPRMLDGGAWATYVLVEDLAATLSAVLGAGGSVLVGPERSHGGDLISLVADPAGAPFGIRQAPAALVAEVVDVPTTWQMSALHSPDLSTAASFYSTVLGWRLDVDPGGSELSLWCLDGSNRRADDPNLPDDVVAVATRSDPATPPHWAVNVQVIDIDATANHAVELGGGLLMPPTDTPGFRSAVLVDPGGAVLAITHPRQ